MLRAAEIDEEDDEDNRKVTFRQAARLSPSPFLTL